MPRDLAKQRVKVGLFRPLESGGALLRRSPEQSGKLLDVAPPARHHVEQIIVSAAARRQGGGFPQAPLSAWSAVPCLFGDAAVHRPPRCYLGLAGLLACSLPLAAAEADLSEYRTLDKAVTARAVRTGPAA